VLDPPPSFFISDTYYGKMQSRRVILEGSSKEARREKNGAACGVEVLHFKLLFRTAEMSISLQPPLGLPSGAYKQ
jgi:hypothetical protein